MRASKSTRRPRPAHRRSPAASRSASPCARWRLKIPPGCAAARRCAANGAPIRVPVGEAVLGRLLDAVGELADRGPPLPPDTLVSADPRAGARPRPARRGPREIFHTGIKVIDLLAPLVKGGKAAMFGGAGVGKTVLIMELIRTTVERHAGHFGFRRHRRALARGPRAVAGTAAVRRAGAHRAGIRADERAARRALAGRPDRACHRRVFPRRSARERAAADRQRLPPGAGGRRGVRPARPAAVARRLSADAGQRDRRAGGAHRLGRGRRHHLDPGGLCARGRLHRPGRGRDFQPPRFLHRAVARHGERGHVSGDRPARLDFEPARSAPGRRGALPHRAETSAKPSPITASCRRSSRCSASRNSAQRIASAVGRARGG